MKRRDNEAVEIESIDNNTTNTFTMSMENKDEDLFDVDKLRATLNPLIVSMKCFGLCYGDVFPRNKVQSISVAPYGNDANTKSPLPAVIQYPFFSKPGFWYSLLVLLVAWGFVVFAAVGIFLADSFMATLNRFVMVGWFVLCASQQLTCLLTTSNRPKSSPLSNFDKFVQEFVLVSGRNVSQTKRTVRIATVVTWLIVICNSVLLVTGFHHPDDHIRNSVRDMIFEKGLNLSESNQDILFYIYTPTEMLFGGMWIFPACYYIILCLIVANRFDEVFERASSAIKNKKVNLAALRKEHVQLCHVVSSLDEVLSVLGSISYAIYIPVVVCSISICIRIFTSTALINRILLVFWIFSNSLVLLVCSIAGAKVNSSAYQLSDVLYDINVNDLDKKSELELMLLLSNLNSNYTGLTIGGVVTVTKGMIITLFGTILGYLTILIQL